MEDTPEVKQRRQKSRRFGILSVALLFLSALFSSVTFSLLLIFGLTGIYFAFLWLYFSYQAAPKTKSFQYGNVSPSSWSSAARRNPMPSSRVGFLIAVGGMILIFFVSLFAFISNSSSESYSAIDMEVSDSAVPEAEDYFTTLRNDPNNIDALTLVGNSFYNDERYDSALYYYNRVLRLDANNSAALYNKALVRFNQKDFSGAAELVLRCVQIDPSNMEALMLLGDCYEDQGNLDLALTQYNKAYELGARTPGLSNMLAYIYDTKGNAGKAISFYKETLGQDSSRADVYARLAELEPANKTWYMKKAEEWKAK